MWSEVAAIYRASKKKRDINWFTEHICRPPAALVVYALRGTRVTPNQLTFASLALAAVAGAMFALGPGYAWGVAAVVVFEISFVLDCADGQLARLRGRSSVLGHLLDFLMDEIKAMLIFACITIRQWREGGGDELYLVCGLGGLFALASALSLTAFTRRPEYGAKGPTAEGQPAEIARRRGLGALLTLVEHAARSVVHYPQYIWLVALIGRFDLYFWAYGAVTVLYLGRTFLAVVWRLGRSAPLLSSSREEPPS